LAENTRSRSFFAELTGGLFFAFVCFAGLAAIISKDEF